VLIRAGVVSAVAASGLTFGGVAAHASATLSASSTAVWGATDSQVQRNAENAAYGNLWSAAQAHGYSTCVNVTYNDTLYYIVPSGGGYVYDSTATGLCGNLAFHPVRP
jgi:hypothetical protein